MLNNPSWSDNFSAGMLPNGIGGVFVAMGMTFIAFEGYEIIAQSGEEVKNPAHNIPRAIFYSIGAVVIIYICGNPTTRLCSLAISSTSQRGGYSARCRAIYTNGGNADFD